MFRGLADAPDADGGGDATGNLFFGVFMSEICQQVYDEEYETKRVFFLWALIRSFFFGDLGGSCGDMCGDLCGADPCTRFEVSDGGSRCACGAFLCDTNTECTSDGVCQCKSGFRGTGTFCCDESTDTCVSTKGSASDCDGNGKCMWDDSNLDLNADIMELTVTEGGPTITCARRIDITTSWVGNCDADAMGATFLKRTDKDGLDHVFGSITVRNETTGNYDACKISPDFALQGTVLCRPLSSFPNDAPVIEPDDEPTVAERKEKGGRKLKVSEEMHAGRNLAYNGRYDDSGGNIDILFVWTREAECQPDGEERCVLNADTFFNMNGRIDLAVEETNNAFRNSGVDTKLRVVHAYRDSEYSESNDRSLETDMKDLQTTNDNKLGKVHVYRKKYGADLVAMIVSRGDYCGKAYKPAFGVFEDSENYVFSVIKYDCLTGAPYGKSRHDRLLRSMHSF